MGSLATGTMLLLFYTALLFNFNKFGNFPNVEGASVTNPSNDESEYPKDVTNGNNMDVVSPRNLHVPGSQNDLPDKLSAEGKPFSQMNEENNPQHEKPEASYKFVIHPDDEIGHQPNQTRFRRFPKSCNDSLVRMKNAVITCWVWPNFLTCEISCSHGYAMKEDGEIKRTTTRKCRESRVKWHPSHHFPSCEPYLNCKTVLHSPGTLICKSKPPAPRYCDIKCEAYEEHDAIPERRYECIDEKYAETLPHCASLGRKEALIQPPQ